MKKIGINSHKIAKIGKLQLERKWVAVFAFLALLFLLVPIVRIMLYTTPWYDDYSYSLVSRRLWLQDHSLSGVLWGAWYTARTNWWAWQGTFSSGFLMAIMPGLFGENYYFIGPMLILFVLAMGCFALVRVIKGDSWDCLSLQAGVTGIIVVLVHSPWNGFFWYNAGVHYVMMHGFFMLLVAALIKLFYEKSKPLIGLLIFWSILGAVLVGGSNYVTALQGMIVLSTLFVLGVIFFKKKSLLLLPSFLVYVYCFYKNVSAPGNAVRSAILASRGGQKDAVSSVLYSFVEAYDHIPMFSGWLLLLVILLLLPTIWNMVKRSSFRFRFPLLVTVYSVCLYAAGFTPSLYSIGNGGPDRALNAVKFTYQILLVINIVYWLGWLANRKKKGKLLEKDIPAYWWFYLLAGIFMSAMVLVSPDIARGCLSYRAYHDVHSGEAYNYYQEYQNRIALIKAGGADVQVPPCYFRTELLSQGELSTDSNAEQNRFMANWYDKNSLSLKLE